MDSSVIDQAFGQNWAIYLGDCVLGMRGLPDNSVHLIAYSPPFLALYIYSDSVADLGNTESEEQFFEGYRFSIREQYRTLEPGRFVAVHCKDTMRYMSSHGYAGLYDFPGDIIQAFQTEGFLFNRWITVWKDPVIEMQRTKTYGLLHKSFCERAEVTRQGCADYVLIFQKPYYDQGQISIVSESSPELPVSVRQRIKHQWSQVGDGVDYNDFAPHLTIWSKPLSYYTSEFIDLLSQRTESGRITVIHCRHLPALYSDGSSCKFDMMGEVIKRFQSQGNWKFHSRSALTDGTYLVAFRNWRGEVKSGAVKHQLKAPDLIRYQYQANDTHLYWFDADRTKHNDYVGTQPPVNWHDDSYYSILVWQKYASPVWFDLPGLPASHPDCWMDINQTDVLNSSLIHKEEGEKHICPLQLDLIGRLIEENTRPGEVVMTPYLGIGSEVYEAVKRKRYGIGFELKKEYWTWAGSYLREAELKMSQQPLFDFAGIEAA